MSGTGLYFVGQSSPNNGIWGSTCHNRRSQCLIEICIETKTQRQWYLKKYVSQQEVWTLVQIDVEKYKCRKKVLEKLNCDIVLQGSRAQDLDTKKLTNMAVFGYAIAPKCEPCCTPLGGPFVNCQLELFLPHHKIIFVHSKKPSQPIAMSNLFLPQLYMTHIYFYLNVYFFFYSYFLSNIYSYFLFFYFLNKFLLLLPSLPSYMTLFYKWLEPRFPGTAFRWDQENQY